MNFIFFEWIYHIFFGNYIHAYRFGRKWALVYTLLGTTIMSLIRAMSPSYVFYVVIEFLEAILSGSIYSICFIIGNYYNCFETNKKIYILVIHTAIVTDYQITKIHI
jgi:MFS family permease